MNGYRYTVQLSIKSGPAWLQLVRQENPSQYVLTGKPAHSDVTRGLEFAASEGYRRSVELTASLLMAPGNASPPSTYSAAVTHTFQLETTYDNRGPQFSAYTLSAAETLVCITGQACALTYTEGINVTDVDSGFGDRLTMDSNGLPSWLRLSVEKRTSISDYATGTNPETSVFKLRGTTPAVASDVATGLPATSSFYLTVSDKSRAQTTLQVTVYIIPADATIWVQSVSRMVAQQNSMFLASVPKETFAVKPGSPAISRYTAAVIVASVDRLTASHLQDVGSGDWTPCSWIRVFYTEDYPQRALLSGVPSYRDPLVLCKVRVTAITTSGTKAAVDIPIYVNNTNDAPLVIGSFPTVIKSPGEYFETTIDVSKAFVDPDSSFGDRLKTTILFTGTSRVAADYMQTLPSFLQVLCDDSARTCVLKGIPTENDIGLWPLAVQTVDTHGSTASAMFSLRVTIPRAFSTLLSSWSECSSACNGTRSRSAVCVDSAANVVNTANCPDAATVTEFCNTAARSCYAPHYVTSGWSACSDVCMRTAVDGSLLIPHTERQVVCWDPALGATTSESSCKTIGIVKPFAQRSCNLQRCVGSVVNGTQQPSPPPIAMSTCSGFQDPLGTFSLSPLPPASYQPLFVTISFSFNI
jgi:hypothetical protein